MQTYGHFQGFPLYFFCRKFGLVSSLMTHVRSLRKRLAQTTMSWVSVKAVVIEFSAFDFRARFFHPEFCGSWEQGGKI